MGKYQTPQRIVQMPDISLTDSMDNTVSAATIDFSHGSSLLRYLQSEVLHLAVLPDFLDRKDKILSQAATEPIQLTASAKHGFQLGVSKPSITIAPSGKAVITVNANPGTALFEHDAFAPSYAVPANTAYAGLQLEGSFDVGVAGSVSDFSFGFDQSSGITLQFFKAFPLGNGEPTLGSAISSTLAHYTIPASVPDFDSLEVNDVATIAGEGSLQISGSVEVSASPNPLASAELPLTLGELKLQAGAAADVSVGFTLSCAYQVRIRRLDSEAVELTITRDKDSAYELKASGSGGFTAEFHDQELISALIGAISKDTSSDANPFAGLSASETATLASAVRGGIDHHLKASLNVLLSVDHQSDAAFQYEIRPALLGNDGIDAINHALHGDLRSLTEMESRVHIDGKLAPGIVVSRSLLAKTRDRGLNLNLNLLGILNFTSLSDLLRHSEILTDEVSGDITIKETASGHVISALSDPLERHEALRKAIYDSVVATTTYRAGRAVSLAGLNCEQVHFAVNSKTSNETIARYVRWLSTLNLLTPDKQLKVKDQLHSGGKSTCVLRTSYADKDCDAMFLDASGKAHTRAHYLDIGRQALRALLDIESSPNDRYRLKIMDDGLWPQALSLGPVPTIGPLAGLSADDPRVELLVGDVYVISQWAAAMADAALQVQSMRIWISGADLHTVLSNPDFNRRREDLQKKLAGMIKTSKVRFAEPWGMVSLYWSAGSPNTAYGRITEDALSLTASSDCSLEIHSHWQPQGSHS
jgi:hypothetical protein